MNHYLVTPWNVDRFDLDWLLERQTLFEKFTLPSVLSQTNQNFEWILMSDTRTPDSFKKVLDAYPATVVYGDFVDIKSWSSDRHKTRFNRGVQLEYAVAPALKEYLETKEADYVVTTRLDNDDAISTNHIDKIQKCVEQSWPQHDRFWLNLVRGYKWCGGNVYPIGALQNPFISFVEPQGDLLTAYQCCHQQAPGSGYPVVQIREGHPTWMQVIHGGNLMNRLMRYRGEMSFAEVSKYFTIEEKT